MLEEIYGEPTAPVKIGTLVIREALGQPLLDQLLARGLDPEALVDQLSRMPRLVRREAIEIILRNAATPIVGPASDQGQPRTTAGMRWRVYRRRGLAGLGREPGR